MDDLCGDLRGEIGDHRRRRAGIFVAPVQVTGQMVEALFKRGDLCEADALDLDCVGEAIAAAARRDLDLT